MTELKGKIDNIIIIEDINTPISIMDGMRQIYKEIEDLNNTID